MITRANRMDREIIRQYNVALVKLNIPGLEKIDFNHLLNLILNDKFTKPVNINFGFNEYKKDLFKVNMDQDNDTSISNIFSFTYNSYPMLLVETRHFFPGNVTPSQYPTPPHDERNLKLYVHVAKPENFVFHSASKGEAKKYTSMDLPKFDKLFPCVRSDETNFRVIFTPATQVEMIDIVGNDNQYKMGMKNGVFAISHDHTKTFPLHHDLTIVNHKDKIAASISQDATKAVNVLTTLLKFFNTIGLYQSPFLQKQKHDYLDDDILPEELEIYLNNSEVNYLYKGMIHGCVNCYEGKHNHFEIHATSYNAHHQTQQINNHTITLTYYSECNDKFYCFIEKSPKNFSKY
jgi:hypothetical protein